MVDKNKEVSRSPRAKNRIERRLISRYRKATSCWRALPDFIIIGVQKGGTTSIFEYLSQHPQIIPSTNKEVHFFDGGLNPKIDNYNKGKFWYRSHFPLKWIYKEHIVTGEASPLYIFNPLAPKRMARMVPGVKIVVLLRDPVARAISHYFHECRAGREHLDMKSAFLAEESRLQTALSESRFKSPEYIHFSYKNRGLYKKQLDRYFQLFPKNQIHIINSEDFFQNPENTLRSLFSFIGVDEEIALSDLSARNVNSDKNESNTGILSYLEDYFWQEKEDIYNEIGIDLNRK